MLINCGFDTFFAVQVYLGVIQLKAQSIEDNEIKFNIFIYNVEDKIKINYLDVTSTLQ